MHTLLFVLGTRPEAIKLAPLIKAFEAGKRHKVHVCVTAQHREMLDDVLGFFSIVPDDDLGLMQPGQTLAGLTAAAVAGLDQVIRRVKPRMIFVQGDTTTVLTASLTAYYHQVEVAHIEAGLRSHDKYAPFPEEMNRLLTSRLTDYHFVPTRGAALNLEKEGITRHVYQVGNTVIDALKLGLQIMEQQHPSFPELEKHLDPEKKILLITCHRRESFGEPFENICLAFNEIARSYPELQLVYPVHLNPRVQEAAHRLLNRENIKLLPPLNYPAFLWLMNRSHLVLTDSGGIQEEAPSLGKPVLVLREVTERTEGIEAGTALLAGTSTEVIVRETKNLLDNADRYRAMARAVNPYGDGTASEQIVSIVDRVLDTEKS